MSASLRRRAWRWLTAVWIALTVLGSLAPLPVKEAAGTETRSTERAAHRRAHTRHRSGHLLVFGTAAILLGGCYRKFTPRLAASIALLALGVALEYTQFWMSGWMVLETWDMRDDAIGITAGLLLATVLPLNRWVEAGAATQLTPAG